MTHNLQYMDDINYELDHLLNFKYEETSFTDQPDDSPNVADQNQYDEAEFNHESNMADENHVNNNTESRHDMGYESGIGSEVEVSPRSSVDNRNGEASADVGNKLLSTIIDMNDDFEQNTNPNVINFHLENQLGLGNNSEVQIVDNNDNVSNSARNSFVLDENRNCDSVEKISNNATASRDGRKKISETFQQSTCPVRFIQHKETEAARGVTANESLIFIVRENLEEISVYDAFTLALAHNITVKDMKSPGSVIINAELNRLYVSDWGLKCIHVLDLSVEVDRSVREVKHKENKKVENSNEETSQVEENGGERSARSSNENDHVIISIIQHPAERWPVPGGWPRGLSLTPQGNLLVTVLDEYGSSGRVLEYVADSGEVLKVVTMDETVIIWPHQTLQLSSGQLMISHGMCLDPLHQVSHMDDDGRVVKHFGEKKDDKKYGEKKGENDKELDCPYSVCRDVDDVIYVADCSQNKVKILHPDLSYKGKISAIKDLNRPYRLFFDARHGRLYIGEAVSGRVLVLG